MPVRPDLEWQAHLEEGRFMLPADAETGKPFYPPRAIVPGTGCTGVIWVPACGRGTVYSTTTLHRKPPEPGLNVALIDLDEGPRMMSRVEGIAASAVTIGMRVVARIRTGDEGGAILVFEPARTTA